MDVVKRYKSTRQKLFDAEGIQPQSKFIATDGPVKNVHYLKTGAGPPLILIHGGGSHSGEWTKIIKPLSEHFQLYIIDRPGCGLSDSFDYGGVDLQEHAAAFIQSFMNAIGLEKASIMAQSMGGYFSICFAFRYPERLKQLLLIGAPAGINRWIPPMLRLMGTKGINRILINTIAKPSPKSVKQFHDQLLVADIDNLSDDYIRHVYYSQLLPGAQKSFLSLLENALTVKGWRKSLYIGDKLSQLKIPVHFIWGDQDAFEKPKSASPKISAIEDYTFKKVENAGHCPWLDQPEYCSRLISSLLQT